MELVEQVIFSKSNVKYICNLKICDYALCDFEFSLNNNMVMNKSKYVH